MKVLDVVNERIAELEYQISKQERQLIADGANARINIHINYRIRQLEDLKILNETIRMLLVGYN